MSMESRFSDRVAIVTGGASGIGKAIARRIAQEGGQVAIFDRDAAALERAASAPLDGAALTPLAVDVSSEESLQGAIQQVTAQFGRLDILVNSAGVVGPTSTPILDYRSEDFTQVMQINLFGSFFAAKYAIQAMLPNRYGRIVMISSMAGKDGNPGMVGYSVSKAAVIGLVKSLGKEYAETGITVNGIAPAVIRTPMNEATAPEQLRYLTERIPMKRLGTVDEAAALACWIASEEASFTTGFIFDLSGGRATY